MCHKVICCLIGGFLVATNAIAQNALRPSGSSPDPGVILSIAPLVTMSASGKGITTKVRISNQTKGFLVKRYVGEHNAVAIELHELNGPVPERTDQSCQWHHLKDCGPEVRLDSHSHGYEMVIAPGATSTFDVDISSEYYLDPAKSYLLDIALKGAVLVYPPSSFITAPKSAQDMALSRFEQYKYIQVAELRSNGETVQQVQ